MFVARVLPFLRLPVVLCATALLVLACGGDGSPSGPGDPPGDGDDDVPVLSAPSGTSAEALSSSRIRVTWSDNSTDEDGFEIQRSPDGSSWSEVDVVDAGDTALEDTGLERDTRYVYRVRARRGSDRSDWSTTADATTLTGTVGDIRELERRIRGVLPSADVALEDRDLFEELAAAAEAIRGAPGVDTTIVSPDMLTVQNLMADGTTHLFVHSRASVDRLSAESAPSMTTQKPGESATKVVGPPGSARAIAVSVDGGQSTTDKVRNLLDQEGYNVLSTGASLADMRSGYRDLGALYLSTHGAAFLRVRKNPSGGVSPDGQVYAIQTSTVMGTSLGSIRSELLSGDLVILTAVDDQTGAGISKIGVTDRFIQKHWSLDNAVVVLHSCYGGAGSFVDENGNQLDSGPIQQAILGAGADAMMGFDNLTWDSVAEPSILYFFDRMLGADSFRPEDPPARPFDAPRVRTAMRLENLVTFFKPKHTFAGVPIIGGNDVNVTFHGLSDQTTLAPTIRTVDIVDDQAVGTGKATLTGLFGDDQGSVEVGQAPVTITSWSNRSVEVDVPFSGPGSSGPVVIKTPDDIESNEVPMTEWRTEVTLTTVTPEGLTGTSTLDLRFRADVHAFRDDVKQEPEHRKLETYVNPASEGESRGSGSTVTGAGDILRWTGTHEIPVLTLAEIETGGLNPAGQRPGFGAKVTLDPAMGEAEICLQALGTVTLVSEGPTGTVTQTGLGAVGPHPSTVDRVEGFLGCTTVTLDTESWTIGPHSASGKEEDVDFTLRWEEMAPTSPPTDDTAG